MQCICTLTIIPRVCMYIIIYMHCNENESEKKWNDRVKHVHTTFAYAAITCLDSYALYFMLPSVVQLSTCSGYEYSHKERLSDSTAGGCQVLCQELCSLDVGQ